MCKPTPITDAPSLRAAQNAPATPAGPVALGERTVALAALDLELTGTLFHDEGLRALWLETEEGPEVLSVDLSAYGLTAGAGHVWVRDYSEHQGLAAALRDAGIAATVETATIGPFHSVVALVRLAGADGLDEDELAALA